MRAADRDDLELATTAAREAGEVARRYFQGVAKSWHKHDRSPVTEADMEVDRLLHERLRAARPHYGWLSEEREDDPSRLGHDRVFIVDPIDGTRAFIAREPGWVISIGIVEAGSPRVGVLFAPASGELWTAARDGGARRNGETLRVGDRDGVAGLRVGGSARMAERIGLGDGDRFTHHKDKSLARRMARVAAGDYDVALASENARDWDIAAAALIATEAGARVTDLQGAPPVFNREDPRHPALLAAPPRVHETLLQRQRHREPSA